MKTIKKNDQIKRVYNEIASELIKHGWAYCPKHEWKNRSNVEVTDLKMVAEIQAIDEKQKLKNEKLIEKLVKAETKKKNKKVKKETKETAE